MSKRTGYTLEHYSMVKMQQQYEQLGEALIAAASAAREGSYSVTVIYPNGSRVTVTHG